MRNNDHLPRYSAATCQMLEIPVWWAGRPMTELRLATILLNK